MSPPPARTLTLHWAHVPPPPQADETKIPASARLPSSLPPAGNVERLLLVDQDLHLAAGHQQRAGDQDQDHQGQHDAGEHRDAEEDLKHDVCYPYLADQELDRPRRPLYS